MEENNQLSASLEDYLETIYLIVQKKQAARAKAVYQAQINDWIDITWSLFNNPEFIYRH